MALSPGDVVDNKYQVVRLLGEGGMGAVYEGLNSRINRRVAIKVLHASFAADPDVTQRFEREAQAAGRIGNDHILEILDLGGLPTGDHYMVMEYLDGETLGARIREKGRLSEREAAYLVRQVLEGLAAAHQARIVHRDLKPENIFVLKNKANQTDFVKIIDFGISKFQALNQEGGSRTRMGTLLGSPYYMSPEQASGNATGDPRSDLYSVGVILYESVTGKVPYDAQTLNQLMFKIVLADFVPPESLVRELDPGFGSIVAKAMAKDPEHRFQTAEQFMAAIDGWLASGKPVTLPPLDSGGSLIQKALGASSIVTGASPQAATQHGVPAAAKTSGGFSASQTGSVPKKGQAAAVGALVVLMLFGLAGAGGALWYFRSANTAENLEAPKELAGPAVPEVATPKANEPAAAPNAVPSGPDVFPASSVSAPSSAPIDSATETATDRKATGGTPISRGGTPKPPSDSPEPAVEPPTPPPVVTPPAPKKKKRRDFGY